jgi:hypothetical protein
MNTQLTCANFQSAMVGRKYSAPAVQRPALTC